MEVKQKVFTKKCAIKCNLTFEDLRQMDLHSLGGIYFIKNKVTKKFYIGKTTLLWGRYKTHCSNLAYNCHHSKELQADYNKYGKDNFVFTMGFTRMVPAKRVNQQEKLEQSNFLGMLEAHFINKYKGRTYNIQEYAPLYTKYVA